MGPTVEGGGGGRTPIRFGTYNIQNRRNGGLGSSLRGMGQSNMDVRVFQKMIYIWVSYGYRVVATSETSRHRGGVTLFYWDSPTFAVEDIGQFGANFITYQLASGDRRCYIV